MLLDSLLIGSSIIFGSFVLANAMDRRAESAISRAESARRHRIVGIKCWSAAEVGAQSCPRPPPGFHLFMLVRPPCSLALFSQSAPVI